MVSRCGAAVGALARAKRLMDTWRVPPDVAQARVEAAARRLRVALMHAADAHSRAAELELRAAALYTRFGDGVKAAEHRDRARTQLQRAADDRGRAAEVA
jgi:hypothetical protein